MNRNTKQLVERVVKKLPYSQSADDFIADAVQAYVDVLKKERVLKNI
tara:strand:+ start:393 stop:533 length:141 start_codon:yes stop_codon:yes gene_type:complete